MTQPLIMPYQGKSPKIHPSAFIAPTAVIIGDVEIGAESSIWFGCVLRGDVNEIRIGARTNLQDGTVVHVAEAGQGTYIGDEVTVGHAALLHACTIGHRVLVGMRATLMDDVQVATESLIASGALVTPNKQILRGQVWAGSPAKHWRDLSQEDIDLISVRAAQYVRLGQSYK